MNEARMPSALRARLVTLYAVLTVANIAAWLWALIAFAGQPALLGTAALAYGLGLRHAVDADHIAAIDNVTRKLMQQDREAVTAGFWFSLGHSSVVLLLTVVFALGAGGFGQRFESVKAWGGLAGTGISAAFLLAIAAVNVVILREVWAAFRSVRRGERPALAADVAFAGGAATRFLGGLFRLIGRSWHMYPLGILFGLGFETASEVGLIGVSAVAAAKGLAVWNILVFPALFAAGMSLIDTTDGALMLGAYGWAFVKPVRKLYYNLAITAASVAVALVVGGLEALALIGDRLQLDGRFWDGIAALNGEVGLIGYAAIAFFILSWGIAVVVYRVKRFDELDCEPSR